MADSQGSVERPVRNAADVEFFFVTGMVTGGTRPTVARREFRDWLAERDATRQQLADLRAGVAALREAANDTIAEEFLRALPPAEYGETAVETAAEWLNEYANNIERKVDRDR